MSVLRTSKESDMVVRQQEHENITAIKAMVAARDIDAIRALADNEWSVTYLIIAASHLTNDAKAVGARISNVPANERRVAVVNILLELAMSQAAPEVAPPSEPPFDVVEAAPQSSSVAETAPAAPARRRGRRTATPDADVVEAHPQLEAAQPLAPAVDFDRAFNDILAAVAQSAETIQRRVDSISEGVAWVPQQVSSLAADIAQINARLDTLAFNAALFRDGVIAFEQELAMAGVIGNAVFSEATAAWK